MGADIYDWERVNGKGSYQKLVDGGCSPEAGSHQDGCSHKPRLGDGAKSRDDLSLEDQLRWYGVYSHVLMLNCSARTRCAAAAEADRELGTFTRDLRG